MAQHTNYWSCSKFADWLRGTPKPESASIPGWKIWKDAAWNAHKIRYWMAETGLIKLQDIVMYPATLYHDIDYYIQNRWVTKTHAMTSTLKRGQWWEFETRLLHCSFDTLVDFVEIEEAWHTVMWNDEDRAKFNFPKGRWARRSWRSPEAGIAHLTWASNLVVDEGMGAKPGDVDYGKPTGQAVDALETLTLYQWWKHIRPQRPEEHEASGWTAYCDLKRDDMFDDTNDTQALKELKDRAFNNLREIEEAYEQEDTAMLIRLVKLRKRLWT